MGYFRKAFKGIFWMSLLRAASRVLIFAKTIILARLLSPFEFGIFGIALLVLSFLETISETGINVFFIQGEGETKKYIDTAWVVSIIRGFLIFILLFALSSIISLFFKSPESKNLIILISFVPLVRGFINPAIIEFRKKLNFKREFYFRLIVTTVEVFSTVIIALTTKSAISVVWGLLISAFVECALSFILIEIRPMLKFEFEKIKSITNRGKWVTLAGIFNYLFTNGDDIFVGRILDKASLGIYQVGYKISSLPLTEVSQVLQSVFFPIYSKFSDDKLRIKKAFIKSVLAVFLMVFPFGILFTFFSKEVVIILLGDKWLDSVLIVQILAFFGIIRALTQITYPLFLSMKKQEYVMYVTLAGILGMGATIYSFVVNYQIVGAAYSALTGAIVAIPVSYFLVYKLLVK